VHHAEISSSIQGLGMEPEDHYRNFALATVVADTPLAFWQRLAERVPFAYGESFSSVKSDRGLLDEQRQQKLYQERYFKMEFEFVEAALRTGVPASAKLIGTNSCHYAYVAQGRVGLTQSYVAVSGEMPKPASFRQQLAEMVAFKRVLRLPLSDESVELVTPKSVFGILVHSPAGRKFTEDEQKLGALGLFVPYDDCCSGWAAQLSVSEIIAAYAPAEKREDRAMPTRRRVGKTGTQE
jgi:hypothetical protein